MGNIEYAHLPRYIAVKVSPERWCIATLYGSDTREGGEPSYVITSDKMTQGHCDYTLMLLQDKWRKNRENPERT